jgi:hypothetical protein
VSDSFTKSTTHHYTPACQPASAILIHASVKIQIIIQILNLEGRLQIMRNANSKSMKVQGVLYHDDHSSALEELLQLFNVFNLISETTEAMSKLCSF